MKQLETLSEPFFARFLETQKNDTQIQAGFPWPPIITDKLRDSVEQTQKYPSDGDEI